MALGYVLDSRALETRSQRLARRDPNIRGWVQKFDGRTARREWCGRGKESLEKGLQSALGDAGTKTGQMSQWS